MTERERALSLLELSRGQLTKLLEGLPADKVLYQPTPAVNHAVWIVGHLAAVDNMVLRSLDESQPALPENYASLFDFGSEMQSAEEYPPFEDVLNHLHAKRESLVAAINKADDAKLASEMPEFGCDVMGALFMTGWHEGWHAGQLSIIRRSLNLPSIFAGEG